MSKWMLKQSSANIEELARQTGLSLVLARILAVRGYRNADQIREFLQAEQAPLADPLQFADMRTAVEIAAAALEAGCTCAVFGDYDADGIMSTVIMMRSLRALGAQPLYAIPQREGEGYGLNNDAILRLFEQGVEVIFACDNGISAFEQIEYANSLGITVVVLDHHAVTIEQEPDGAARQSLPPAAAIVDAKRLDCPYPFKHYCAAGLCYRFSQALYAYMEQDWTFLERELLPFAAIATICDLVELTGENRTLVARGIKELPLADNPGLNALIAASGLLKHEIGVYQIGYIIGPCINASGRLDIADIAVELFLNEDIDTATRLSQKLVELNKQRRKLTEDGAQLAFRLIEQERLDRDKIIVLHCTELWESVAGIIAGRVKERYYHPCVLLVGKNAVVRGSCRSIEGYNIYEGLFACRELLPAFGGHPMAAGLSIAVENIGLLRQKLNEQCSLSDDDLQPVYRVDCPLQLSQVSLPLAKELERLSPFGKGNPPPLFGLRGVKLIKITLLGKEEQVMRLLLRQENSHVEAVAFSGKEKMRDYIIREEGGEQAWRNCLSGATAGENIFFDLLCQVQINRFNGREAVQCRVVDFRPAGA